MQLLNDPVTVAWAGILIVVLTTVGSVGVAIGIMKGDIKSLRKMLQHHIEIDHVPRAEQGGKPSRVLTEPAD